MGRFEWGQPQYYLLKIEFAVVQLKLISLYKMDQRICFPCGVKWFRMGNSFHPFKLVKLKCSPLDLSYSYMHTL